MTRCAGKDCPLDAVEGRHVCAAHADYFDRVLADPRFRTQPLPSMYVVRIRRSGKTVDVGQQGAIGL